MTSTSKYSMADSAPAQAPTPPPETPSWVPSIASNFDVVSNFTALLKLDPLLTPPIAAIESLISLLSISPPSTTSETLSLLSAASKRLKAGAPTSSLLAISAGTDLFQRYIINTLQARGSEKWDREKWKTNEFKAVRAHLLANSRLFVQRAKDARTGIASRAKHFVRDGSIICTCGGSRVVSAVLNAAADNGSLFQVIYVRSDMDRPNIQLVNELREKDIPVAVAPFAALATAIKKSTFAMVGAENVVENGGVISGLGAYQMGLLSKSLGTPFYVVAESYKFVRFFPLRSDDMAGGGPVGALKFETMQAEAGGEWVWEEQTDLTPPELITALITEEGVHSPSAVSEELIKMWY